MKVSYTRFHNPRGRNSIRPYYNTITPPKSRVLKERLALTPLPSTNLLLFLLISIPSLPYYFLGVFLLKIE